MATSRRRSGQRGFALIFYSTMLVFVVACCGLAVDVGTIYMIKARLSSAVDSAALAAGRSVNLANTVAEAQDAATTTAQNFFTANFPTGYFNTVGTPTATSTLTQETDGNGNPNGVLDIAVTASATAPTYFMHIFNLSSIPVRATGTASRRGLVLMLVLDQSSSMNTATTPTACQQMVTAAQNFITLLSPYDYVGLVKFDLTAHMMDSPTTNRTQVNTDIGAITCGSNTNTTSALELAYQQIKLTNLPLALNTIILFTDGSPNGVTASFPVRTSVDTRFGPALTTPAPPVQSPANSCVDDTGVQTPAYGGSLAGHSWYGDQEWNNQPCVNMPLVCGATAATIYGAISQVSGQNPYGGDTQGLQNPTAGVISADAPSAPDAKSLPASCSTYDGALPANTMRQFVAYIPFTDAYGNNLHGVTASGTSPYGSVAGGMETRDFWLFQTNGLCSPTSTVVPNCKNTGGPWSGVAIGTGSNFFTAGAYSGLGFRPDQPNSIVAASMNGTMSEAYRIRSDTTYHPVIHTIYLTGNGSDSVDHEFLAVVSNSALITPLPYDSAGVLPYANPAYQTSQETGKYLVTADNTQLAGLFAQLASELLRISH